MGLKLAEAKEVQCIKVKQQDREHGVRAAVLEKSVDCEVSIGDDTVISWSVLHMSLPHMSQGWARVAEFPDFPKSYDEEETFQFQLMSTVPNGVFQIRSRHDVGLCWGCEVSFCDPHLTTF